MDHATMTGTMGSMSPTMSMDMPATTSGAHAGHDMGGMGMGGGNSCKISMLFNFYTVDACFLSSQWHVTSRGMFAGSCIGVFLLAMSLEFLRRSVKEFDRFLVRQHIAKHQGAGTDRGSVSSKDAAAPIAAPAGGVCPAVVPPFRPNVFQQAIRAFLHFLQFTVAYFLMLLAMYFNIYIIVSIILGAFFGAFIFQWETLPLVGQQTSAAQEATVCCG